MGRCAFETTAKVWLYLINGAISDFWGKIISSKHQVIKAIKAEGFIYKYVRVGDLCYFVVAHLYVLFALLYDVFNT